MAVWPTTIDFAVANSDAVCSLSRKAALCVKASKQSPAEDRDPCAAHCRKPFAPRREHAGGRVLAPDRQRQGDKGFLNQD
jgi:hypothetical protein